MPLLFSGYLLAFEKRIYTSGFSSSVVDASSCLRPSRGTAPRVCKKECVVSLQPEDLGVWVMRGPSYALLLLKIGRVYACPPAVGRAACRQRDFLCLEQSRKVSAEDHPDYYCCCSLVHLAGAYISSPQQAIEHYKQMVKAQQSHRSRLLRKLHKTVLLHIHTMRALG